MGRPLANACLMDTPSALHPLAPSDSQQRLGRAHVSPRRVEDFVVALLGPSMHARRVDSIALAVTGVLHAASLAIHAIGRGYAAAAGRNAKHGTKQIDRLLSNTGIELMRLFDAWVRFVVGARKEIVVALDWTEFDKDDQATLCLYLITRHGRATPLVWKTVLKSTLAGKRNDYEYRVVRQLGDILPADVAVTLLADRGFGDQKLYEFLRTFGWSYAIRFRQAIKVTNASGETKEAVEWAFPNGRPRMLKGALVTDAKASAPAVVIVHDPGMAEAWCIATNLTELTARQVAKLYGRRFTIEETFRDTKDVHFGMGLSATHIGSTDRRDRLLFLGAVAYALLVLLGAAGEACGLDRSLKANTVRRRTLSLYKQGCHWYDSIPNMPEERLETLMASYEKCIREQAVFLEVFGLL